jgi:hypothetical protein
MTLLYEILQLWARLLRRTTTGTGYADSQRDDLTRFFDGDDNNHGDIKHDGFRFRTRFSLCVFLPTVATIFRQTGVTWAHFQCYDDKYEEGFSTFCLHNGDFCLKKLKSIEHLLEKVAIF